VTSLSTTYGHCGDNYLVYYCNARPVMGNGQDFKYLSKVVYQILCTRKWMAAKSRSQVKDMIAAVNPGRGEPGMPGGCSAQVSIAAESFVPATNPGATRGGSATAPLSNAAVILAVPSPSATSQGGLSGSSTSIHDAGAPAAPSSGFAAPCAMALPKPINFFTTPRAEAPVAPINFFATRD
jgi:hypothetical protein